MKPEDTNTVDYDQPVAYDVKGQPLYAHPVEVSRPEAMVASQAVHMARPIEIEKPFVSDATKIKHDRSHKLYPGLDLSEGEYVIAVVPRHPIGLFPSFALALAATIVALSVLFSYDSIIKTLGLKGLSANTAMMSLPILMFILLVCLLMYVRYYVYTSNRFYLTNECVTEYTQRGLFSHVEKSISLGSIEDASYTQTNIVQQLINYGSIRLSTVGDETTYSYDYVALPKQHIDMLNSAVEAFKNGRPVS